MSKNGTQTATVDVTNTGNYDGDEIVQLYIRDMVGSITRPVQELKGFERVNIKKGETKTISFEITPELLQFYDQNYNEVLEPGDFQVMVGPNSRDIITKTFILE